MKTIRIIQLILLVALTITLIIVLYSFVTGSFSFSMRFNQFMGPSAEIYDVTYQDEPLEYVHIDVNVANVSFEISEETSVRVVYHGPEREIEEPKVMTTFSDGRLYIYEERPERYTFTNALTESRKVIVYLPADFAGELICTVVSGSIRANRDFDVSSISLKSVSGSISFQNVLTSAFISNSASGGFSAQHLEAESIEIKIVSGSINILDVTGQSEMSTTSGSINITNFSGAGSVSSSSGSIRVGLQDMTHDLSISTTSGSVNLTIYNPDLSAYCEFNTTSGSISAHFAQADSQLAGSRLSATMGDHPEHQLSIKVTSGSIRVSADT